MIWWQYINQFSFFVIVAFVVALLWLVLRRRSTGVRAAVVVAVAIGSVAFFFPRQHESGVVTSAQQLDRVFDQGMPVALEFFSNY